MEKTREQEIKETEELIEKETIRLTALKEQAVIEKLLYGMANPSIIISTLQDDPCFNTQGTGVIKDPRRVSLIRGDRGGDEIKKTKFVWVNFDSLIYFMKKNPKIPVSVGELWLSFSLGS